METFFEKPYPARAAVGVSSLPRDVCIEAEAIMIIEN
jgi:enamine deaminase RidA (YjgF/YER057c/UK114 family)